MQVLRIPFLLIVMQTVPDFFVGSIVGLSGFVTLILNRMPGVATQIHFRQESFWKGPYCSFYGYWMSSSSTVSLIMATLIAFQRYESVSRPLARRLKPNILIGLYITIWFAGFSIQAIPFLTVGYVLQPPYIMCSGFAGSPAYSWIALIGIVGNSINATMLYLKIFALINNLNRERGAWRFCNAMDSDLKMFFVLMLCMVVCWIPQEVQLLFEMVHLHSPSLNSVSFEFVVALSAINPFLCLFFSTELRQDASALIKKTLDTIPLLSFLSRKHTVSPVIYQCNASGLVAASIEGGENLPSPSSSLQSQHSAAATCMGTCPSNRYARL